MQTNNDNDIHRVASVPDMLESNDNFDETMSIKITQVPSIIIPANRIATAMKYAPIFRLHSKEVFLPSSFDYVLGNVHVEGSILRINQTLTKPEQILPWFYGTNNPTPYILYSESKANPNMWTANYFLFYPYNKGKTILGYQIGNHVGDWEHASITFINSNPITITWSYHAKFESVPWSSNVVSKLGGRPVFYIAKGSHGVHPSVGKFKYLGDLAFFVYDETDSGPIIDMNSAIFITSDNANGYQYTVDAKGNNVPLSCISNIPWTAYNLFGHPALGKVKLLNFTLWRLSGYNKIPTKEYTSN